MGEGVSGMNRNAKYRLASRGFAWALALVVLCGLVALNLGLEAADNAAYLRLDLSPDRVTALSERSRAALDGLTANVTFTVARRTGAQSELGDLLDELLAKYAAQSPFVSVRVVDPDARPYVIAPLNADGATVTDDTVFISTADAGRVRRVDSDQLIYEKQLDGETYRLFCGDARFAGALEMLSAAKAPRAVFLTGHGESADVTTVQLALTAAGFAAETLSLSQAALTAEDTLIILAPQTDLTEAETETLAAFVDGGGKLLVAVGADADLPRLGHFSTLLSLYGLGFEGGRTVEGDAQRYVDAPDRLVPLMTDAEIDQSVTQRLIFPAACAVAPPSLRSDVTTETLLTTSATSYRKLASGDLYVFESGDVSGRQTLALAAENTAGARIVQLASAEAFTDGGDALDAGDNLAFFTACVGWLSGEQVAAGSADLKVLPNHALVFADEAEQQRAMILSVAVLPAAVALAGVIVLLIRRRRAC